MRHFISLLLLASILFSSCSSSNDVVSRGAISKRKYREGFHLDLRKRNHKDIAKSYTAGESAASQVSQVEKEDISKHSTSIIPSEKVKEVDTIDNSIFHKFWQRKKNSKDSYNSTEDFETESRIEPEKIRKKRNRLSSESDDQLSHDEILAIVFTYLALVTLTIPILGLIFSILGIVFSRKAEKEKAKGFSEILKLVSIMFLVISILFNLMLFSYILVLVLLIGF